MQQQYFEYMEHGKFALNSNIKTGHTLMELTQFLIGGGGNVNGRLQSFDVIILFSTI